MNSPALPRSPAARAIASTVADYFSLSYEGTSRTPVCTPACPRSATASPRLGVGRGGKVAIDVDALSRSLATLAASGSVARGSSAVAASPLSFAAAGACLSRPATMFPPSSSPALHSTRETVTVRTPSSSPSERRRPSVLRISDLPPLVLPYSRGINPSSASSTASSTASSFRMENLNLLGLGLGLGLDEGEMVMRRRGSESTVEGESGSECETVMGGGRGGGGSRWSTSGSESESGEEGEGYESWGLGKAEGGGGGGLNRIPFVHLFSSPPPSPFKAYRLLTFVRRDVGRTPYPERNAWIEDGDVEALYGY